MDLTEVGLFSTQYNYTEPYNQRGGQAQALKWTKEKDSDNYYVQEDSNYWRNGTSLSTQYIKYDGSKMHNAIDSTNQSPTNSSRVVFSKK